MDGLEIATPQIRSCLTKANEEAKAQFKASLANKLVGIPEIDSIGCHNVHCQNTLHQNEIEKYTLMVLVKKEDQ